MKNHIACPHIDTLSRPPVNVKGRQKIPLKLLLLAFVDRSPGRIRIIEPTKSPFWTPFNRGCFAGGRRWFACYAVIAVLLSPYSDVGAEHRHAVLPRILALDKLSLDLSHFCSAADGSQVRVRYRLFPPRASLAHKRYPLIVWLHGHGDRGNDNLSQLNHFDATVYAKGASESYPFYIVAPQCSRTPDRGWVSPLHQESTDANSRSSGDDMLDATIEIIDHLLQEYPIDENRITVIGISAGGSASLSFAARYPHRFAAIAPLAAARVSIPNDSVRQTPVWAFHNSKDPGTPVDGIRRTIADIQNAGGIAHLTELAGEGHYCWKSAFADHDLLHWLLKQRRNAVDAAPGTYRLAVRAPRLWRQFWPRLIGFGLGGAFVAVCYWHWRGKPLFSRRQQYLSKAQ